uniref:hypothetical protein n=1 Tax=Endozoicomonas arenosclerae TaxID=1633495 RepID=UPI000B1F3280
QSYLFSDSHGASRDMHLLAYSANGLSTGTTECVLDIPLHPETLDLRQVDSSSRVLERRYSSAETGAVESHVVMPHRDDVEPSFMILLEEKSNGQRFLVIFSIDTGGNISTHTVYLDNQNDRTFNELSWEEVSMSPGESCRLRNRMGFQFVQCLAEADTGQFSKPLSDGEYEVGFTEDGLFIRTAQSGPRFLQLPTFVRTRAFRGWGFKLVNSSKMAAVVAKRPPDLRATVTERWQNDEDFDRFSQLAEALYKLVRLSSDKPKRGSPTYGKSDDELNEYWQQVSKLIGKVLAEQLITIETLSAFKSQLGIGTPTYTITMENVGGVMQRRPMSAEAFAVQIARDLIGFVFKRGYKDLWPAYMEMLFAARNIGQAKIVDFSADAMVSGFYAIMAEHGLWSHVHSDASPDTHSDPGDNNSVRTEMTELTIDEEQ